MKQHRKRRQPLGIRFCPTGQRLTIADLHERYWACVQRLHPRGRGGKSNDLALGNLRGEMGIISTALSYAQQANDPWVAWTWSQGYREAVESFYQSLGGRDLHRRVALYRLLRMQLRRIALGAGTDCAAPARIDARREQALLARYGTSVDTPVVPRLPTTWRWYLQTQATLVASDAASQTEWYRCGGTHYIVLRGYLLREQSRSDEDSFRSLYQVLVDADRRADWFARLDEHDQRLAARATAWGKVGAPALPGHDPA